MERRCSNPESPPSDLALASPEPDTQDAHHERDLLLSRHTDGNCPSNAWGGTGTLIPSEFREDHPGPENRRISLEACRRSMDFQMEQYLHYVAKVRHAGIEPKKLLSGLVITDTGPNAPPPEFWRLVAVRDRFISQANALLQEMRNERTNVSADFPRKSGISVALAITPIIISHLYDQFTTQGIIKSVLEIPASIGREFVSLVQSMSPLPSAGGVAHLNPYVLSASLLPLVYIALKYWKVHAASRCVSVLESVVERATNWELDERDRDELEQFARWFRVVV
ncbi:hypothetical protein QBC34DRAFT_436981 [Podospora aff. communis PSN243]|uniref:Uncharacterized protein n=1 Tax=Podospora aff. communis PSN243 TaxID=3040156 RepID=A0AAV9GQA3_9PEZI|nr:hypothetical protein QBC34DRAFT_436981 [Podospora aff. communis PSN243]